MRDDIINACLDGLIETGAFVAFYGAANREFRLGIGDVRVTFLVKEDPQDGYRSSMEGVFHPEPDDATIFFETPIAEVQVIKGRASEPPDTYHSGSEGDLYHLRDREGHIWLEWGTDDSDDYYPSFIFNYEPKAGVQ